MQCFHVSGDFTMYLFFKQILTKYLNSEAFKLPEVCNNFHSGRHVIGI
jgi:hypothetical protein